MKHQFRIGDRVRVVKPEPSLRAVIGELATVVGLDCEYIDLKWDEPRNQCRRGCYPSQFEPAGGPW